ncbi:anti-sigma factor family protein [Streptomyces sp. LN245]|uniref:anti-sigma factor family protein n=1 Tax=Streptomyces sp. LN245 TaxID=3112975 RepID=UPI00371DAA88
MTGWHAPDDLVTRYADGSLPETDAWSLEKHLERCGPCAARVSHTVRAGAAGQALAEVRDAVLTAVREPAPAGTTASAARLRTGPAAGPVPDRAPAAPPRGARAFGGGSRGSCGPPDRPFAGPGPGPWCSSPWVRPPSPTRADGRAYGPCCWPSPPSSRSPGSPSPTGGTPIRSTRSRWRLPPAGCAFC